MDPAHREFARVFGEAIVARDLDAAHRLLASWLRRDMTAAELRAVVEERLTEMLPYAGLDELTYPVDFDVDGNACTIDDLREPRSYAPVRPIPDEVTPENFRKWLCVQFLAEEGAEIDAWFDMWMILVEEDGALRVGYFELEDPD